MIIFPIYFNFYNQYKRKLYYTKLSTRISIDLISIVNLKDIISHYHLYKYMILMKIKY